MGLDWLSICVMAVYILQVSQLSSEASVLHDNNKDTRLARTAKSDKELLYGTTKEVMQGRGHVARTNWTREEIIGLIHRHGYKMKEGSGGQIYVLMGDILMYPQEIIPELKGEWSSARRTLLKDYLWLDENGEAKVEYFYDTQTKADQNLFEKAVKTWADSTCIKFKKISPNTCDKDLGHAAVCVGNFSGCYSMVGKRYGPSSQHSQQMSVQPGGCEDVACAHEFGHALGLIHEMARADREEFIKVHFENVDIPLGKIKDKTEVSNKWSVGSKTCSKELYDAPKPYDPMSLMHYGASDFAHEDCRIVYASLNAKHQYMFDYHRPAGYGQTHYDFYIINKGYKCEERWRKACESKGTTPPKCQNSGYTKESCKCACPPGFSGNACEKLTGALFPIQDRAKAQVDVTEPGVVDLAGKGLKDGGTYPNPFFANFYFIGVYIKSGENTRISVRVLHDFSKLSEDYGKTQDFFIQGINSRDCSYGLRLYVGDMQTGNARTECMSRILNNEFSSEAPVFTSKNGSLDFIGIGSIALAPCGNLSSTGRHAMELKFHVAFSEMPERVLSKEEKPGVLGKNSLIWIIVIAVGACFILLVFVMAIVLCIRRKKRLKAKREQAHHFYHYFIPSLSDSGTESETESDGDSDSD